MFYKPVWKILIPNVTHGWETSAERVPAAGESGARTSLQASGSISFVICSFVFMQQPREKLVPDLEEILPRTAYNVAICSHIKFFFTYKNDADHKGFKEWHAKCQVQEEMQQHI